MLERLQKIISTAGVASRRKAEELILEGSVTVNGKVATELGTRADAEKDHIKVNGKLINPQQQKVYILLNKPKNYITSLHDPEGRPTVLSLLKGVKGRVYPVGRLDYDTEGLLLLTNDGEFANALMHPKKEIQKTYQVKVKGVLEEERIKKLEEGIFLYGKKTAPATVKKQGKTEENSWIELTIHEGKNRQIKKMLFKLNHPVLKIKRVRYAFLELRDLPVGKYRFLDSSEVKKLKSLTLSDSTLSSKTPKVVNQ
ncbi:MAG: rRNA pseudouridine synthase [Nitrospirae bacterium]|nr:rRNA pseudouridine synthase [Nitrospirota bacterium]MBI3353099.1 rRNA pseudouridine synthase [Nitrospirota bacterium]